MLSPEHTGACWDATLMSNQESLCHWKAYYTVFEIAPHSLNRSSEKDQVTEVVPGGIYYLGCRGHYHFRKHLIGQLQCCDCSALGVIDFSGSPFLEQGD